MSSHLELEVEREAVQEEEGGEAMDLPAEVVEVEVLGQLVETNPSRLLQPLLVAEVAGEGEVPEEEEREAKRPAKEEKLLFRYGKMIKKLN